MRNEPRYHRPLQPENPRSWARRRSVSRPFARAIGSGLPRRVISSAPPVPRATRSATPPFSEATSLLSGRTRRHSVEPERRSSGAPVRSPMRTDVAVRQASLTGGGAGGPPPGTPAVVRGGVRPCLMPAGAGWAPLGAACVPSAGPSRGRLAAHPAATAARTSATTKRLTSRMGRRRDAAKHDLPSGAGRRGDVPGAPGQGFHGEKGEGHRFLRVGGYSQFVARAKSASRERGADRVEEGRVLRTAARYDDLVGLPGAGHSDRAQDARGGDRDRGAQAVLHRAPLGAFQKAVPERGAEFLAPRALRGPPREVGVGEKFPHHALVGAAACRECAPFVMPR